MPKVVLEIHVPDSDYCWDGTTRCEYVDLHEFSLRAASCGLKFNLPAKDTKGRVFKAERCKKLEAKGKTYFTHASGGIRVATDKTS